MSTIEKNETEKNVKKNSGCPCGPSCDCPEPCPCAPACGCAKKS
ncbi:MAG: hypothetical protein JWP87_1825 [Labilithrix sp.]|nr:hypothetical protein [Labilithrix sp.]